MAGEVPEGKRSTRERLLRAAGELFYREGTVAVGVDKVCAQAQVSKRSMYQLFATKDELVAASLRQSGEALMAQYLPGLDGVDPADATSPRERILSVFSWLDQAAGTTVFAGCPFVNAAIELKDAEHPAALVAREFKHQLTGFFEQQAEALGATDPGLLAQQLTIVFDGFGARKVVTGEALSGLAVATATVFLDDAARRVPA